MTAHNGTGNSAQTTHAFIPFSVWANTWLRMHRLMDECFFKNCHRAWKWTNLMLNAQFFSIFYALILIEFCSCNGWYEVIFAGPLVMFQAAPFPQTDECYPGLWTRMMTADFYGACREISIFSWTPRQKKSPILMNLFLFKLKKGIKSIKWSLLKSHWKVYRNLRDSSHHSELHWLLCFANERS